MSLFTEAWDRSSSVLRSSIVALVGRGVSRRLFSNRTRPTLPPRSFLLAEERRAEAASVKAAFGRGLVAFAGITSVSAKPP